MNIPRKSVVCSRKLVGPCSGKAKAITRSGKILNSVVVDSKIKSRHTANGILKDAGIGKKF